MTINRLRYRPAWAARACRAPREGSSQNRSRFTSPRSSSGVAKGA